MATVLPEIGFTGEILAKALNWMDYKVHRRGQDLNALNQLSGFWQLWIVLSTFWVVRLYVANKLWHVRLFDIVAPVKVTLGGDPHWDRLDILRTGTLTWLVFPAYLPPIAIRVAPGNLLALHDGTRCRPPIAQLDEQTMDGA